MNFSGGGGRKSLACWLLRGNMTKSITRDLFLPEEEKRRMGRMRWREDERGVAGGRISKIFGCSSCQLVALDRWWIFVGGPPINIRDLGTQCRCSFIFFS